MTTNFNRLRRLVLTVLGLWLALLLSTAHAAELGDGAGLHWYKGNTHAHSFWSDGDEFPEMAADWYKSHGYQFLALSDHNVLMQGDRNTSRASPAVIKKCQKRFGSGWLEIREGNGGSRQVKLKTFAQIGAKMNEPGRFLLIQNEEVTSGFGNRSVHMNTINLAKMIPPAQGNSVTDTIARIVAAADEQSKRLNRTIVTHLNHPNFSEYDVSPEDVARAVATRFIEVCNGHPGVHNLGNALYPSAERLWDIAISFRLAKMKAPPLFAFGTDDTHNYQAMSPALANPGRAWIMVRAKELAAEALLDAISRGDFYASTGVILRDVNYDAKQQTLNVKVKAEPGVKYTIEFIGAPKGVDPTGTPLEVAGAPAQKAHRPAMKYPPEVGQVFSRVQDASATYRLTGDELYVRAVVRSDEPVPNVTADRIARQEAWCQPVGWERGQSH
jgi:hypothetical protein